MNNDLSLIEEKLNDFLPVLKSMYPDTRKNEVAIKKELISMYENVTLDKNILIALYDHRKASLFYLSDNSERVTGYTKDTMIKWGSLLLFKALHYSHYSYVFTSIKLGLQFDKTIPIKERKKSNFYCCGLKIVNNNNEIKRAFLKNKTLLLDDKGQNDISVTFIEDVSHLIKGDHYWMRSQNENRTLVHVHQKGKKKFKEILSKRELNVLKLVAAHKTNNEIAEQLNLSKLTIETHRKNMLKRTGAIDTTALIHLCKKTNVF